MRIKILMMFKDEGLLLKSWIKYHARLVGKSNLILFDNGSTCTITKAVIAWAKTHKICIDQSKSTPIDFVDKGELFREIIQEKTFPYRADFYFPMDCDEFIATLSNGQPCFNPTKLLSVVNKKAGNTRAFSIRGCFDNIIGSKDRFVWNELQEKRFFSAGNCFYLDNGFHAGLGMHGDEPVPTDIVYFHFHWKPFDELQRSAKMKLVPFITDFSEKSLRSYASPVNQGHHCADLLLMSREEYANRFAGVQSVHIPGLEVAFHKVGTKVPYDFGPVRGGLFNAMMMRLTPGYLAD